MIGRLTVLILAIPVFASAASGDLSAALQKARVGNTLRLQTAAAPVVGRYEGIAHGMMVISGKTKSQIPLDTVRSIEEFQSARSTGIKWGALIGLAAGIGVAVLTDKSNDSTVSDSHFDLARYSYHAVAGILVGGSIGGIIGSKKGQWVPIYP
jgi:hypothetical protein